MKLLRVHIICFLIGIVMCYSRAKAQQGSHFMDMQFADATHGYLLSSFGELYTYNPTMSQWDLIAQLNTGSYDVVFVNATTGYILTNYEGVQYTADGGKTWEFLPGSWDYSGNGRWVKATSIEGHFWMAGNWSYIIEPNITYMVMRWGRTTDSALPDSNELVMEQMVVSDITVVPPRTKFVTGMMYDSQTQAHFGYVLVDTSAASFREWRLVYRDSIPDRSFRAIDFIDKKYGWGCGENGLIMATEDGGQSWEAQQASTEKTLNSICFYDHKMGFAVGEGGSILKTSNGGEQWRSVESLTSANLKALGFATQDTIWVAGLDRTLMFSVDGGETWALGTVTSINNQVTFGIPNTSFLQPSYPNPFNGETIIPYEMTRSAHVRITVYNIRGRQIATLVNGFKPEGSYTTRWRGRDSNGDPVSSGLYACQLQVDTHRETVKLLYIK